ncbi:MAG: hypothetical protein K6G50_05920 [bacterium]|nr:hypothetical protein [bacterium]
MPEQVTCPLLSAPCIKEQCAWYSPGADKCAAQALGMVLENLHNIHVKAYRTYIEQPKQNNNNQQ